jgi:ArsR family transcriptional regulator, arsenate/arsenite/antimonite-responsive transcriptional repressor
MTAEERAKIFKALADPRRVEIVDLLANCSQCGTDLAESLGISMALLCHHWDVLVDAGILRKERVGQKRICTLDTARIREATGEWEPTVESGTSAAAARALPRELPAVKAAAKGPRATAKGAKAAAKVGATARSSSSAVDAPADAARARRPRKRAIK